MPDVIADPRWVTVAEAAGLTGWPKNYIRKLACSGELPAARFGRAWAIDRQALLARKAHMEALGTRKHNPWRADLVERGRGRKRKEPTARKRPRRVALEVLLTDRATAETLAALPTEALAAEIAALCLELGLQMPAGVTAYDLAERMQRAARDGGEA